MSEHDFIDIGSGNAGIGECVGSDPDHQALDGLGIELAERRVRPSDDAGCHGHSPWKPTNGSGGELTTKFVLDVNPDDVVKGLFGRGEAELERPFRLEIA